MFVYAKKGVHRFLRKCLMFKHVEKKRRVFVRLMLAGMLYKETVRRHWKNVFNFFEFQNHFFLNSISSNHLGPPSLTSYCVLNVNSNNALNSFEMSVTWVEMI